jgi:hypothetical protein
MKNSLARSKILPGYSFKIAGSSVRFSIRNLVSENGDINYERDEYNLNLSEEGNKMIGTLRRQVSYEDLEMPHVDVTPIILFSSDWNSRSTKSQP